MSKFVDVVVVGGGLSGLAAARDLVAGGKSVVVLEGNNRVGGRTWTEPVPGSNGAWVDMGGQWVGPTQDRILALIKKFGLKTFPFYTKGNLQLYFNNQKLVFPPDDIHINGKTGKSPVPATTLRDLISAFTKINALAHTVPPAAPWTALNATALDSMTVADWMAANVTDPMAAFILKEGVAGSRRDLRPAIGRAARAGRDLPVADVLEVPLPAGLRVAVPCGVPERGPRPWPGLLCGSLVLADEAAEDGLALDPFLTCARLLGVSRTTIESWLQAGVLTPAPARRRRHEVTIDSLVRLQLLLEELRRLGRSRELRDYVWWSAQDAADYADGKLAEALRQLRAGELGDEYVPSAEDLSWARRQLRDGAAEDES